MVDLVVIPHSADLEEVRVYFEDVGIGKGYVTITCWGCAWSQYFGGMGDDTIRHFFEHSGTYYLADKMGCREHFKQRKADFVHLRKIIDAVKAHLKVTP